MKMLALGVQLVEPLLKVCIVMGEGACYWISYKINTNE